jgi:tetratricopeptide (TPR) repeat protein
MALISYGDLSQDEAIPEAIGAVRRALEIDDTLAEGYTALATLQSFLWDWKSAEIGYKKAIELNPNYSLAHKEYGQILSWLGRFDEAIIEIKKAQELDPLSLATNRVAGQVLHEARRYDQAELEFKKVLAMNPNFRLVHFYLASNYYKRGMYKEALEELQKEEDLSNEMDVIGIFVELYKGLIHFRMGDRNKAREMLDYLLNLSEQTYVPLYAIAHLYFLLGDTEQGFDWVEKAYEKRESWLVRIKVDTIFDSVRSDPRYKEILRKMNLE